ncbi:MAG: NADH-quinone oxidoreductase subunit NuoH [Dehalococcoidia bacterium]
MTEELLIALAKVLVLMGFLLGLFSLMTYLERRILAFMQFRLGPNRTGPFGILQPVADGIKLFFKEEFIPAGANRWLFLAAPAVAVVTAFLAVAVVPYGGSVTIAGREIVLQIADLEVGVLYLFAIASLGVYGVVLAGWAANNKYSLLGGLRSSAQMFSYELALGMSWVSLIMVAGSFRIQDIVAVQEGPWGLLHWNAVIQFPAFVIYMIAATAEVSRTPFDLPEAEAELVAGFHTEYASMKFALLQMAEYINMITVAALGSNLFLGGGLSPVPFLPDSPLWFLLKLGAILFVFIWLRGTLPRIRYDQLMRFGWKVLIPAVTLWIFLAASVVLLLDR